MKDTGPEMLDMQREFLMAKTDSEKFMMSIDMYETAKAFVKSEILFENPNISFSELRKEIFRRFYKNDFSKYEMEKIISLF